MWLSAQLDIRALDVTNFDALPAFVDAVVRDYGRLDVLVNNAGFAVAGFAEDIKLEELRLQFETNFFGAVAMTKAALPTMRRQRSGSHHHGLFDRQDCTVPPPSAAIPPPSMRSKVGASPCASKSTRSASKSCWSSRERFKPISGPAARSWARTPPKKLLPTSSAACACATRSQALPKRDPIAVARLIASIAQDPNPKLRYLVGRDAKMQLALKRILPWKWHEKLVANFLKID
jgi:hypothetical protein